MPSSLLTQLADKGRLVLPVGKNQQTLQLIERDGDNFITKNISEVKFVPLVDGDIE